MKYCLYVVAAAGFLAPSGAFARPIDMTAFNHLIGIMSPAVSPDGKRVAFIKSVPNLTSDKNMKTLEVADVASGALHALTKAGDDLSLPSWSPAGNAIAYISEGRNKQDQIFTVPLNGGSARQITDAKNGVEQFSWSPDGKQFAFVTQDDPVNAAAAKHHDNLFMIHDDGYQIDGPAQPSHIWLIASGGGSGRRLTHGSWSVLEAAPPFVGTTTNPSWSPDGKYIAFTRQADADNSDSDMTKVAIVDAHTGALHMLTSHPKYEYQPQFSWTSDTVQYIYPHGPGAISVMNVYAGATDVSSNLDRDIQYALWMPDGKSVIALANDHTSVGLWQQALGGSARRIDLGSLNVSDYDVGKSGAIAFVGSTATKAPELYYMATPYVVPVKMTALNDVFANYEFGRSAEFEYMGTDGEHSDGIVTYPVGYESGRKYPLVVYIHGGPEGASSQIFNFGEIGRLRYGLSGHGYIVFEPNYRGSDNLGNTHEHGIYRDPGNGPGRDVMAGVAALQNTGVVDSSNIAIVGHSYGGYMTTWLIGHEHIWRSAVVADGVTDWRQEYDLSAAGNLAWTRDSLGGTPMDPQAAALYRTGSPITYANQITTPTLILSGTADQTVPITESFELYHALNDHGTPVRFIALPAAHHSPSKPVQVDRYYTHILEWVVGHMH